VRGSKHWGQVDLLCNGPPSAIGTDSEDPGAKLKSSSWALMSPQLIGPGDKREIRRPLIPVEHKRHPVTKPWWMARRGRMSACQSGLHAYNLEKTHHGVRLQDGGAEETNCLRCT
jgi:hypothetical protein